MATYADSVQISQAGQDKIKQIKKDAEGKISKEVEIDTSRIEELNKLLVRFMEEQEVARL